MKIIVIGGGLGGLAAAALLAREGHAVTVLEKSSRVGGRAQSEVQDGFVMNLGPHALYNAGPAEEVLRDLEIPLPGGEPKPTGSFALHGGRRYTLPTGALTLLTTGLLSLGGKLELGRFLARAGALDPAPHFATPLSAFLAAELEGAVPRQVFEALARVTTYTNAPEQLSAGVVLAQLQRVERHNVTYLDGGWQPLVDGLRARAEGSGATVESGAKGKAIRVEGGRARAVELENGRVIEADLVVVAASPAVAHALLPGDAAVAAVAARAVAVQASCLDVALSSLPDPRATFALGVDEPLYVSVHSAVARLAPEGQALIQVARYLAPGERAATEAELLAALERLQPGAGARVVARRYLPRMTVAHDVPRAAPGGLAARPAVDAATTASVLLVGDWVGPDGLLADASFASARAAAAAVRALASGERAAA